jgi:hypothetical protein
LGTPPTPTKPGFGHSRNPSAHVPQTPHSAHKRILTRAGPDREEQEQADAALADSKYASCVDFLLSKTRDKERFQLLFQENINYGFRRNLWAMKPVGMTIAVLNLGALAVITALEARTDSVQWFANATAILITSFLLTWWLVRITPNWVKTVADAYSIRLLACIDELQP